MSPRKQNQNPPKKTGKATAKRSGGFTAEERAAMKERVRELKAGKTDGEGAVLAKIAELRGTDRQLAERLHVLIKATAPGLSPRTWYGMPAYARDGKAICFFRADKYMTFGLSDAANHELEEGAPHQLRESAWFFTELDEATEEKLTAIVRKAAR